MKISRRVISIVLLAILSLFTFGGCSNEVESDVAKGYQWKVTKGDKEMYLVGTIHLSDGRYNYVNDNIKKIMEKSDGLAVEVDVTNNEVIEASLKFSYYNGKSIEDELTPEEIEKLKSICTDINIPYEGIKIMTPSTIMAAIQNYSFQKIGSDKEGVDAQLLYAMKEKGREIVQVETVDFQLNLLAELQNINTLKEFLKGQEKGKFLENNKKDEEDAKALVNSYINGDTGLLENEVVKLKESDLNTYNKMAKDRNVGMVKKFEELFNSNKTYVYAVGALHYFGDDGIIKLLEDDGYKVERIN